MKRNGLRELGRVEEWIERARTDREEWIERARTDREKWRKR